MRVLLTALMLAFVSITTIDSAYAQQPAPECTEDKKKEIRVELEGIEALRKVGIGGVSLNALRGICTTVRSTEGAVLWIAEPIIRKGLEVTRDLTGIDFTGFDLHVLSRICVNIHHYTDEFAVGRRERELREKLGRCSP